MGAGGQIETGSKKVRGRAQRSADLIAAMYDIAQKAQPITGRGIGYKLFTAGLIPSMARSEMQRVYRLLKEAREEGTVPWEWIVDETRSLERTSTWPTLPNMPVASRDPTGATSGTNSPSMGITATPSKTRDGSRAIPVFEYRKG